MTNFAMLRFISVRSSAFFSVLLATALAIFFTAHGASAATCTYASNGTTDFNTAANWNCGFVPGASSTAIIPNATSTILSAGATVGFLQIGTSNTSSAVLNSNGLPLTVTGSVTSTGTLTAGESLISIGRDMIFAGGGVLTAGSNTSTVTFSTSTSAVFNHRVTSDAALTFRNLNVSSTQTMNLWSNVLFTVGNALAVRQGSLTLINGSDITVTGTSTIFALGTFDMTDSSNVATFSATSTNNGTIGPFASGGPSLTFDGDFVNTGTFSGTAGQSLSVAMNKEWQNTGLFQSGSSTVTFGGGVSGQRIPADLSFYQLTINKTSGRTISNAGNVSTTGAFLVSSGQFNFGTGLFNAYGNVTVSGGTTDVTPGQSNSTGTLAFIGTGSQTLASVTAYNVSVNKPSGTLTCSSFCAMYGILRVANGTFNAGSATVNLNATGTPFVINSTGVFEPNASSFVYLGNSTTTVTPAVYYNLSVSPSSASTTFNLSASTTAIGTLTVGNNSTLAVGANVLTVLGTISNSNLMTETTGSIVHPAESVKVTDASGTEISSVATDGTLYVTIQDSNRNMNGQSAETMTVTLSGNSVSGSDSETLTLVETTPSSGIFRNTTAVNLANSGSASTGNGQLEITASGTGTGSYADNQDSADTGSDTLTLTYTAASTGASTGGGGVGGGGSIPISTSYQVSVQSNQGNLSNLQKIGVAVHSVVKLPNDGDANTQYDSAVYYVGADGKRHAFPNDKVYFTWYTNFDGVQVVNQAQLATIPLGSNVTYKPADRMVKFTTDPKVYVVGKGGLLRWVKTEVAAVELYGAVWNKQIDDINDAFYANYTFGADVNGLVDFNPAMVEASVTHPSDSMAM